MNKTFSEPTAVPAAFGSFDRFINKAGKSYTVDFDALPLVSQKRIIVYGIDQVLADAASSVATTDKVGNNRVPKKGADLAKAQAEAIAFIDQRLADLQAGILRRVRESSVDPVDREATILAIAYIKPLKGWTKWLDENKLSATDKDAVNELARLVAQVKAENRLIKQPDGTKVPIMKVAARRAAENAALKVADDDDDLFQAA